MDFLDPVYARSPSPAQDVELPEEEHIIDLNQFNHSRASTSNTGSTRPSFEQATDRNQESQGDEEQAAFFDYMRRLLRPQEVTSVFGGIGSSTAKKHSISASSSPASITSSLQASPSSSHNETTLVSSLSRWIPFYSSSAPSPSQPATTLPPTPRRSFQSDLTDGLCSRSSIDSNMSMAAEYTHVDVSPLIEGVLSSQLSDAMNTSTIPLSKTRPSLSVDFKAPIPPTPPPKVHLQPVNSIPSSYRPPIGLSQLMASSSSSSAIHQQRWMQRTNLAGHSLPTASVSTQLPSLPSPTVEEMEDEGRLQRMRTARAKSNAKGKVKETSSLMGFGGARGTISGSGDYSSLESLNDLLRARKREFSTGTAPSRFHQTSPWLKSHAEDVQEMLDPKDRGSNIEESEDKIQRRHKAPKYPIVFCHGLLGFDVLGPASLPSLQISHWRGIREILEDNGAEVMITRVPATSSIKERAQILHDAIAERYPGQSVNLIGHSMGGLDCRYLISQIHPKGFNVVSLSTISTPHRGSPFADYVIDNIIGRSNLPAFINLIDALSLPHQGDGSAFEQLGTAQMKQFNLEVLDDPSVKYYSWGAQFDPSYLNTFKWPHSVILGKEGPNDGLVSVKSAKWGEYKGTLEGVNHLDLVGWVNTVRYSLAELVGKPISFKPATFYLELADALAEGGL